MVQLVRNKNLAKTADELERQARPVTIHELSKNTGLAWSTTKKAVNQLVEEDIVETQTKGDKNLYSLKKEFDHPGCPISGKMSLQYDGRQLFVRIPEKIRNHPEADFDENDDVIVHFNPSKTDQFVVEIEQDKNKKPTKGDSE